MKAIAYSRVSHQYQADTGSSIDTQDKQINIYCQLKEIEIVKSFKDEAVSGRKMERPGITSMFEELETGQYDCVIVYSISRFGRNIKEVLEYIDRINKMGISFHCVDMNLVTRDKGNAAGMLILQIIAAMAEFESNQISERITVSLRTKKKSGNTYCANPPLGFDNVDGKMVPVKDEMKIVQAIFDFKGSLSGCASKLNRMGVRGKNGGKFAAQTIKKIKKNEQIYLPFLTSSNATG